MTFAFGTQNDQASHQYRPDRRAPRKKPASASAEAEMPIAVTSNRPFASRVRSAGIVRPRRRAASDAPAMTIPKVPRTSASEKGTPAIEQHRPERAEYDDAYQVGESCEPGDVGPDLPAAHEPEDCETAGEEEHVQGHKARKRLHAHCGGTVTIDTPSSPCQTTFDPDPYTVVSHP